jgi:drug/metabolite transporter (DMT)-like permease
LLTIVLGFATALVYGFADFFGAVASKRIKPVAVTAAAGAIGLVLLVCLIPIFGFSLDPGAIQWGIWAGVWSAIALSCLYASLALGPISIVSPIGAVVSAIVPAAVGIGLGESFSAWGWLALALLLAAVVLVGFVPGDDVRLPSPTAFVLAVSAGAGIGAVLICLDAAPADSGLTPVIMLRAVSAVILGLFLLFTIRKKTADTAPNPGKMRNFWLATVAAGIFDSSANVFFLLASRTGTLTVVSVLTALYPLGTIILARVFLKEKIARTQMFGVILALGASAILAVA